MSKIRIFSHWSEVGQLVQSQIDDTITRPAPCYTHVELTDLDINILCMCIPALRELLDSRHHTLTIIAITLRRQHTRTYVDEMLTGLRGYDWGNGATRWPGYYMVNIEKHNGLTTAVTSYRYGTPTTDQVEYHHLESREHTVSDLIVRVKNKNNGRPLPGPTAVIGDC
jgi:hypothetical protein